MSKGFLYVGITLAAGRFRRLNALERFDDLEAAAVGILAQQLRLHFE